MALPLSLIANRYLSPLIVAMSEPSAAPSAGLFPLNEHDPDLGIVTPDGLAFSDGLGCE
jgi:hypothetical protein